MSGECLGSGCPQDVLSAGAQPPPSAGCCRLLAALGGASPGCHPGLAVPSPLEPVMDDAPGKGTAPVARFSITALASAPGRSRVKAGLRCLAGNGVRAAAVGDVFAYEAGQLGSSGTVSAQTMWKSDYSKCRWASLNSSSAAPASPDRCNRSPGYVSRWNTMPRQNCLKSLKFRGC